MPSGLPASHRISARHPITLRTSSANSRIERSSPQPMLKGPGQRSGSKVSSGRPLTKIQAEAASSLCRNSRRGVPLPHTTTSRSP